MSEEIPSSPLNDRGHWKDLPDRRHFVRIIGATAGLVAWQPVRWVLAHHQDADAIDHFVPADKGLSSEWVKSLFATGNRTWYSGSDLETIGMPIGGVCAGQLYLTG